MTPWFNVRKAAQVAAFFALKERGSINVLKLVKLIYLADRRFMEEYDATILSDRLVSMPHGPVHSMTFNYMSGLETSDDWQQFVADREGHNIGLARPGIKVDDLRELSVAELEILEETWAKFGGYKPFELRDYTHDNCPEWEDPHGSSTPIPYARLFRFLGKGLQSEHLEDQVMTERQLSAQF